MCPEQIEFNGIVFKRVPFKGLPEHPERHTAFYVNDGHGGVVGLRRYPDGQKVLVNATGIKRGYAYAHGKQEYLKFIHAWGRHIHIYASHAVYSAFYGCIPPGMTIDHINGCSTDNRFENLRIVSGAVNIRDGGFLTKLRNKGIDPVTIQKAYLLRYFDRMARIKSTISKHHYERLTREDLKYVLYEPAESFSVLRLSN